MKVLIVDDEKNIRDSIARFLKTESIEVKTAENGISAKRLIQEEYFQAAVVDLKMPGMDGLQLLKWLKEEGPNLPVIMISAFGEISDAVEAMKLGARDYIVKPFDPETLIIKLKKLLEEKLIEDRVKLLNKSEQTIEIVAADNSRMQEVIRLVEKVAPTPTTILITGPSGTGKEVVARTIHNIHPGSKFPFVAVNIGGIPENLLESELFGYEKGAFTGANVRKQGLFEIASSGTLLLDEIGDMPIQLQVKLLRVLQEKKIQRLGGTNLIPVDARIIAATNQNLEKLVEDGRFREDLYFRLNVFQIEIPPLRDRREDIPILVSHFINKFNNKLGKNITGIEDEALSILMDYDFPGNVRELENIMERAFILCEGGKITSKDIVIRETKGRIPKKNILSGKALSGKLKDIERNAIMEALLKWDGNRTRAAEELGITRRTLLNKINEYNLKNI